MSAQKFFTKQEFFNRHAPDFNFELDADELIERALLRGFIKCSTGDWYFYTEVEGE
tara:strand:+ start:758 stop:925 length:168 start_codon:yes stop_codon:yes gene_type:complete